jgi:Zn-dependent protease with chaperone function
MSVARQGGKKEREIMNWQSRLEKTVVALNLIGLALGFGALGILILVKGEHGGHSWISGVLGIFVGSLFLLFAFYFCKHNWGRRLGKVSLREAMEYFLPYDRPEVPRRMQTESADLLAVSRQQSGFSNASTRK